MILDKAGMQVQEQKGRKKQDKKMEEKDLKDGQEEKPAAKQRD